MEYGQLNITLGWTFIVLGILSGSTLGMWAFDGPMKLPKGHEQYDDLPRRLIRLAHIALFMLPLISIVYGMHIDKANLSNSQKELGSICFIICMIGVPTALVLASFKTIFKYAAFPAVAAGILALILMAIGQY